MQKILSMVLVIMMLFISTNALGEGTKTDFSTMTLEELIALRDAVTIEIYSRLDFSFEDEQIGAGNYLVGEDIKAGKYEFICTSSETRTQRSSGEVSYLGTIWILDGTSDDAQTLFEYGDIPIGQKIMFELEDSQMLVIGRCGGLIAEYNHSWAP